MEPHRVVVSGATRHRKISSILSKRTNLAEEPLRVLLVDQDPDFRASVRAALEPEFQIVGEVSDGAKILEQCGETQPDAVLIDVAIPNSDGITATRQLMDRYPHLTVVILSATSKFEDLREALAAGARDYVAKPFDADELRATLREARGSRRTSEPLTPPQESGPAGSGIWAFTRATGGVGQTTLLLSVAYELVAREHTVVVLDLHPYFGHVGFYLGLGQRKGNVADLAELPQEFSSAEIGNLTVEHPSGIRVVTAPLEFSQGVEMDWTALCERVKQFATLVDYVLVDMPGGVPDSLLPILDASRYVFVVTSGSYSALLSMRELLKLLIQLEYPLEKLIPVMTGFRSSEKIRQDFNQVLSKNGLQIEASLPFDPEGTARAALAGQPLSKVYPRCEFTEAVQELLKKPLELDQEPVMDPGFLGRVFGALVSKPPGRKS